MIARVTIAGLALLAAATAYAHDLSSGQPAQATAAARVVKVEVREGAGKMVFVPDRVAVMKGDAVSFVIHNGGMLRHEFVIGTTQSNAEHAKMMVEMPGMEHHDANAVDLQPGATRTLTWRFTKSGTFEFACLIPGHYQAGMHGEVAVR